MPIKRQLHRLTLIGVLAVGATACGDSTAPRGVRETAATSIAAGDVSTCALNSAGAAYCWGEDSLGQLGIGQRPGASQSTPVQVSGGHTFAALSGAGEMACGLTSSSQIWCWGGQVGGLAREFFRDSLPTIVSGSVTLVNITSGPFHSCGLTKAGDAYCWGQNSFGQLGNGDTLNMATPVLVQGGHKWSAISAGFWHTCAITTGATPYCWGYPGFGAIGNPVVDTSLKQLTPLAVSGQLSFATISAGAVYTCGVTAFGASYCWGNNAIGQLGDGTDSSRDAPVAVKTPSGVAFTTIAVSRADNVLGTTCGLTSTGAAYCWGNSSNGQLGIASPPTCNLIGAGKGPFFCSFTPVAVSGGLTFSALAIGLLHVCGVTTAGAIDCWGGNAFGQLGDGTTTDTYMPTPVVGGFKAP
ncbi:MAG TPA: hypothetical protein VFA43_14115 [Gemmatimonadaceae bacterium]|nr:hypothetical protein [Gemmatimonadaceae bacterium]